MRLPKISCIYKIQSITFPNRIYIGSSKQFNKRVDCHKNDLKTGKHHNKRLQYHYNKYGADDLEYIIIEPVDNPFDLINREQYHIDNSDPYFNTAKIAGSTLGFKQPQNVKDAVSKSRKGCKLSIEHRQKCSDALRGRKLSDEHKRKIGEKSKLKKGIPVKPRTEQQKLECSLRQIGHEVKESTRQKLRDANIGKKQSPETIAKKIATMKMMREIRKIG